MSRLCSAHNRLSSRAAALPPWHWSGCPQRVWPLEATTFAGGQSPAECMGEMVRGQRHNDAGGWQCAGLPVQGAQADTSQVTDELERSGDLVNLFAHEAHAPWQPNSRRETELSMIIAAGPLGEGASPRRLEFTAATWAYAYVTIAIECTLASEHWYRRC